MEKKIALAVFDWAGTTVDYGSSAPVAVFDRVFREAGIKLSRKEINGPMGLEKRAHIHKLLELENAAEQWKREYHRMWTEEDVDHLYETFEEKLAQVVTEYSDPIDGVVETVARLREMGIKIGSTTGYTSEMMRGVLPKAESCGYKPDCVVTPDVTGEGRPSPFMLFECMRQLHVYPVETVVKVGDTVSDIQEGKNAGAWSIGILQGSNLLGLTREEYDQMETSELAERMKEARAKYFATGADRVIDSIRDLPAAIKEIEKEMNEK